jgi:hypothetical protein
MTEYMIKPNEAGVLAESLKELFQELGDNVTPKIVAERLVKKTGRSYQYHQASYLLRMFGFEARKCEKKDGNRNSRFVVQDDALIERLIKESALISERTRNKVPEISQYSANRNFGNWDYLRPY